MGMINAPTFPEGEIFLRYINNRFNKNKNFIGVTTGPTGCQPKGSKVLMSDGKWNNIEDIKEGDTILSPQKDGTNAFCKVTGTTKWFCDKMFNITQKNRSNRKLYSCSYNHIIPVYKNFKTKGTFNGKRYVKNKWWDFSEYTAESFNKMSSKMKSHQNIGFSSFAIDKYDGKVNCDIEPYSLGVFLGDGMFYNKEYRKISITSDDKEIIKEVEKHYPVMSIGTKKNTTALSYAFNVNSLFGKLLKKNGLEGKGSGTKFIPQDAMLSNLEYRNKLLAGIIDTDGYSIKNSCSYEITLKSKRLIENIRDLVYSIGGRCGETRKVNKSIKSIGFTGVYYSVCFYLGDISLPVKLSRKKNTSSRVYLEPNRIAIDTKKSGSEMVYGIQLDSESKWYITDNWMITHNSGKSYLDLRKAELQHRRRFNEEFPIKNCCFSVAELMERISSGELRTGEILIMEEAGVNIGSGDWQNKIVKMFNYVLQSFRSMNVGIFLNLPVLMMMSKQARQLTHMHMETMGIDFKKGLCKVKPLCHQLNQHTGKSYWKYMRVKKGESIVTVQRMAFGMASDKLVKEYEAKKGKFLIDITNEFTQQLRKLERDKTDKLARHELSDDQKIMLEMHLEGKLQKEIAERVNLTQGTVASALKRIKKWGYSTDRD